MNTLASLGIFAVIVIVGYLLSTAGSVVGYFLAFFGLAAGIIRLIHWLNSTNRE